MLSILNEFSEFLSFFNKIVEKRAFLERGRRGWIRLTKGYLNSLRIYREDFFI